MRRSDHKTILGDHHEDVGGVINILWGAGTVNLKRRLFPWPLERVNVAHASQ